MSIISTSFHPLNRILYKSSTQMSEVLDCSIDLMITSAPYSNIKDYAKNGYQNEKHSESQKEDLGAIADYEKYIKALLRVWRECFRVLKPKIKEHSRLTQKEWIEYTKQIWDRPIPSKSDSAFGKHVAIMPEAIPHRLIKLYSFVRDIVLDPFAGSGTTLKIAKELKRNYIGYELYIHYKSVIEEQLQCKNL